MDEYDSDDENMEVVSLSSPEHQLFDDMGELVQAESIWRQPLALLSPPQQPRRRQTPFKEPSVDRRSKTPLYHGIATAPPDTYDPSNTRRRSRSSLTSTSSGRLSGSTRAYSDGHVSELTHDTQDDYHMSGRNRKSSLTSTSNGRRTTAYSESTHGYVSESTHDTQDDYHMSGRNRKSSLTSTSNGRRTTAYSESTHGYVSESTHEAHDDDYRISNASSKTSQLFGEGITFEEEECEEESTVLSSIIESLAPPRQQHDRRVSFDLEAGVLLDSPGDDSDANVGVLSPSTYDDSSSMVQVAPTAVSNRVRQDPHFPVLRQWTSHLNQEVIRTSHLTTNELYNITGFVSRKIFGEPSDNDLELLRQIHREKVGQLTQVEHEDHFDFALVLTPQAVYEFWADLLDFRAEQLGEAETVESTSPVTLGTEETEDDDETAEENDPVTIDARPFLTPSTGMRRRRKSTASSVASSPAVVKETPKAPYTMPSMRNSIYSSSKFSNDDSGRRMRPRLSMFEKAVGVFSPSVRPSYGSRRTLFDTTTPTPMKETTPVTSSRRRWGNQRAGMTGGSTADLMSPPIRTLKRGESWRKKRPATTLSGRSMPSTGSKRRKRNVIQLEDIPTHVIPRGVAARTNGMMQFLSGLKRGIILRRHRPGAEAVFCKIFSTDGGDTIKFQQIDDEEAMLAFKEQRVRYNRRLSERASPTIVRGVQSRWSQTDVTNAADDELKTFSLPDYIAANQYRKQMLKDKVGVSQKMTDLASKVANSGVIKTAEIIAVHPARHEDPRAKGKRALGTSSLRRSKSEYYGPNTFSLVTRVGRNLGRGKLAKADDSEKWYAGEGNNAQFKVVDFEAATEGEYWLVFRGFLLLHRDAASGRYAAQRAAGFGNKADSHDNVLHKDEFKEPPTVGYMERLIVKWRGVDASYMEGYVAPGAVPPPSDYFLGFRSPGTQIWSRLRQAGLETQRIYALDTRRVMIKVRCPADRLTDVAEVLRLKLKTRDGAFAPFRESSLSVFQPLNDPLDTPLMLGTAASLFKSSERQAIIDFIIRSRIRDSGAELGQSTELGKLIESRVPLHMHGKLDSLYEAWFYYWRKQYWQERDHTSLSIEGTAASRTSTSPGTTSPFSQTTGGDDISDEESQFLPADHQTPNAAKRVVVGSFYQPLDSIEQYFGEKVAFYFAWLQHVSVHLTFLAAAGMIVFICQLATGNWDHWTRPVFSVLVMLWSFIVMVNWRKRSNFLAYRWGTMDYIEQETTRPQFKGEYRKDEITGEWVVYYPSWKRWMKYLISFPLTVAFTVGTLIVILLVHANRDLLLANYIASVDASAGSGEFQMDFSVGAIGQPKPVNSVTLTPELLRDPSFWFIAAGLPALLGLCLPLLNFILMRVSIVLNDFENYRTESEYRTHLIIKVFSFRFVCYFATLYYYAFISTGTKQAIENGILRVGTGVFIYITVSHWWGVFLQIYFPLLIRKYRQRGQRKQLRDELRLIEQEESELENSDAATVEDNEFAEQKKISLINRRLLLDQAQDEIWEEMMLPMHDSFPEYIQAVIQFAYVTCFSVVLPITPLICLINHLASMRLDAYKLCRGRRRPLAHKTGGIGVWEHVLNVVTVIAVLTNCWLVGFTNESFLWLSEKIGYLGVFAVVVGWEHLMLLIKYVMQTTISPLPKCVRDEKKKEEFRRARQMNSVLRAKNGRRSKNMRDDVSLHSAMHDADNAASSAMQCPSSSQPVDSANARSDNVRRRLSTVASEAESDSSASMQQPGSSDKKPSKDKSGGVGAKGSTESPYGLYPIRDSYCTPLARAPPKPESGNISELLGRGIDETDSLATPHESLPSTSRKKEVDKANAAAAQRISSRLAGLEAKMRARDEQNK